IYAVTERGEQLGRVWRCAEPLTPQGIADRVRWQFEGWLKARTPDRPSSGVVRLRLDPEETVEGRSLQLGLWHGGSGGGFRGMGDDGVAAERAGRALVRVQGLLGPESVFTAVLDGGRGPAERVRLVPWGDRRAETGPPGATWPERLPSPSPATVLEKPVPVRVVDEDRREVGITARRRFTSAPGWVGVDGEPVRRVLAWAGPWLTGGSPARDAGAGTRARLQVLLENVAGETEEALLLGFHSAGNPLWTLEGMYD
ncbi:DNA polymerase Y family protein, partial [Amycolatopsis sp. H20-H5]|nr:DNA polymerase Y family protein [Amycolatopsis sp. H20-H5]